MPDADALFVALVMAPASFSRNKFFEMFQQAAQKEARRRAQLVRSILKDLTEPWPHPGSIPGHSEPLIVEELEVDGLFSLTYSVKEFDYTRQVLLTPLEAAALHYALERSGKGHASPAEKSLVEEQLSKLGPEISPQS